MQECKPKRRERPQELRQHAALLKAVGDETRLEIVALLADAGEPVCVCDIEVHFDLSQPTISHHLKVLRKAGWLLSERRGTWVFYEVDRSALDRLDSLSVALRR